MKLFPDKDPVAEAATHENSRQTGFTENWSNALGLAITEDLPVTSRLIPSTTESQRNQKLYEYQQSGDIPQETANFFRGDTDRYARYARNVLGLEDIPTQEEYEENKLLEYAASREMSGKTAAQQGKMGFVGEMVGYAHAMALDPIYATSFLTGYGAAATVGQAALRVGVMEAGIETVAQFSKIPWKEEIGADYGAAQAMTEIAFAGLGAAALAALGKGIEGAVAKRFTAKDMTVGQAVEVFERMAKKDPELEPILNTLRQSDPEDNLAKVMQADEAVDIRKANEGAKAGADTKGDMDMKAQEFEAAEEEIFTKRAGIVEEAADEGVPRGTRGIGRNLPSTESWAKPLDTDIERVNLLQKTSDEKLIKLKTEESMRAKAVTAATKKYEVAERAAKKFEKNPSILVDSPAGRKAKAQAESARTSADTKKATLDTARERSQLAKATLAEAETTVKKEGVPRGTPKPEVKPDTRHPLVKEADDMVVDFDDRISVMEDCF